MIYRIQKTTWRQDRLKYGQILKAMEILKGQFVDFMGNEQALGALIDRLKEEEILPKMMTLLLRPHARTAIGRRLNERRMRKAGMTRENVCHFMELPEIVKVLMDFFLLNVSWINSWMPSATAFISSGASGILRAEGALARLKKISLTWRGAIFASPTTTAPSTPSEGRPGQSS